MPLGAPLMGTIVEVRDDQGAVVTEGEGQVFIGDVVILTHTDAELSSKHMHLTIICAGGEERVCLLDKEETIGPGTMRATGDWVNVISEQLQYLGRRDRLIKRHGKRVNLDSVQQVSFFPAFFSLPCTFHTDTTHRSQQFMTAAV